MVSRASCTVRIFSDWMSSCRVKNGWSVADSFELCWYTTDLHTQIQNHVDEHKNAPDFSQQLFRVCQSNTLFMSCLWLASTCSAWTGGQNRLSSVGFKSQKWSFIQLNIQDARSRFRMLSHFEIFLLSFKTPAHVLHVTSQACGGF